MKDSTDDSVICENERQDCSPEAGVSPITISDVISKLNSTIRASLETKAENTSDSQSNKLKGFELHTRLPDGSARPATDSEISTADFQSKLQHSMAIVESLPDDTAKFQWAEDQRVNVGNIFYQNKEYESAMDVYLTCLTVATPPPPTATDKTHYRTECLLLYVKLMNNLALCTMQLQWYQKTITFCSMAIDQISTTLPTMTTIKKKIDGDKDDIAAVMLEQRMKLHYKRAKAYRLKGEYDLARLDVDHVQTELHSFLNAAMPEGEKYFDVMSNAILKEELSLQQAILRGNRNFKQQQNAMKQLLKQKNISDVANLQSNNGNHDRVMKPLYDDYDTNSIRLQCRTFSTLRAVSNPPAIRQRRKHPSKRTNFVLKLFQAIPYFFVRLRNWIYDALSFLHAKRKNRKF